MKWDEGTVLARGIETIERALRQMVRAKAAAKELNRVTNLIDPAGSIWEQPAELGIVYADFADQTAFVLVAIRHAIAARRILEDIGVELPAFDNRQEWSRLRDVDHHWEKDARGELRARDAWDGFNLSDMPGRHFEITKDGALVGLSGLKIEPLERDLVALHVAAAAASKHYSDRVEETEVISALEPLLEGVTTTPMAPDSWDDFREVLAKVPSDVLDKMIPVLVGLRDHYAPMPLSQSATVLTQALLDTATEARQERKAEDAALDPASETPGAPIVGNAGKPDRHA